MPRITKAYDTSTMFRAPLKAEEPRTPPEVRKKIQALKKLEEDSNHEPTGFKLTKTEENFLKVSGRIDMKLHQLMDIFIEHDADTRIE